MRLRNVKGADKIINNSTYVIKDYEQYKGNYKAVFQNDNEIDVEIGMGKGDFIINMARAYPNINYIGIEKYDSVMVRALEKIEKFIPNLKFIKVDAKNICEIFSNEIDLVYLNFSDPWPKERHQNRRLTSEEFLKRYDSIFKDTKKIIMKTDNRKLFEYSIKSFTDYGYCINNISLDLYKDDISNNISTEYENKFHELGYPIYKISVKK